MQVSNIDVKQETPVGHGDVTCFSIYSASSDAEADFGNGKTCIWVDVLDGGRDVLMEFVPFFEDSAIRKVHLSCLHFFSGARRCIWACLLSFYTPNALQMEKITRLLSQVGNYRRDV